MSPPTPPRPAWRGLDQTNAVLAEFLAGPVVWGGIGWLADSWLGTTPWLLVIGVLVGFAGALYLVWLRLNRPRSDDVKGDRR